MSYAGQVITLRFPELSDDPDKDPVWVVLKNPRLLPPQALQADPADTAAAYEMDDTGQPAIRDGKVIVKDAEAAQRATQKVSSRLVIAWRVHDPDMPPDIDLETGEPAPGTGGYFPQPTGGNGATPEEYAKLPLSIQLRIMETIPEAINPPQGQDTPTPKMSSGPPNPSSTEPGPVGPPPQN